MTDSYDAIIIGGGHNGLTAAAYLAKAGKRVLVLEKRAVLGGAAATEEVFPGYRVNTGAEDAGLFPDAVIRDLGLQEHGLVLQSGPALLFAPQLDGPGLTLWQDERRTVAEIGRFSARDADQFPAFRRQVARMSAILTTMMQHTPPDLSRRRLEDLAAWGGVGLRLKQLGKQEMMAFLRVLPMPASEFLDEWFETPALKGALGAFGVIGLRQGPRSAGTTLMLLYQSSQGLAAIRSVAGGTGQLSTALAQVAQRFGAEIRTGAAVDHILLADTVGMTAPRAAGVILDGGEMIAARAVLSSADPRRTFLDFVGPQNLEPKFVRKVRNIIYRGSVARLILALRGVPAFRGLTDEMQLSGRIRIAPSLDYLERAYDATKYGRMADQPFLDVRLPTILDPGLAPDGRHIMSITMQYAPYGLRGTDWEGARAGLASRILQTLSSFAPGLGTLIEQQHLITPLDLERTYGLAEGSIYHGQMGLDQLLVMRPVAGWGRYLTPIEALFLCGAGAHPGGGVTGAPGRNAAREALKVL